MINFNLTITGGNRTGNDLFHSQQIKADGNADNVYDGIDGTHFMEVNFVDGGTMDFGFRSSNRRKQRQRQFILPGCQTIGLFENLDDVT